MSSCVQTYRRRFSTCEAKKITALNLEDCATFCGGHVKGTKLPPEERCIEFWCKFSDDEVKANIGDYLVKFNSRTYVFSALQFESEFEQQK